jgi:GntR family transcriptional repressor for pyruvate dehydrogenase complex
MIHRTPVPQAAARQLQQMIREGEFAAGERLPSQRVLSERMGISRPSLREALMTLETLGVVQTHAGRGTFVARPGAADLPDHPDWRYGARHSIESVFEVRILIEARLARHAAALATLKDIEALTSLTDRMEQAWAQQDLVANVEADLAFHRGIAARTANTLLAEAYERVGPMLAETQRQPIPFTRAGRMLESIAEHRQIVAALNRRDPDAAERAMVEHIRNTAACAGITV